jgi:hypothetical protein
LGDVQYDTIIDLTPSTDLMIQNAYELANQRGLGSIVLSNFVCHKSHLQQQKLSEAKHDSFDYDRFRRRMYFSNALESDKHHFSKSLTVMSMTYRAIQSFFAGTAPPGTSAEVLVSSFPSTDPH